MRRVVFAVLAHVDECVRRPELQKIAQFGGSDAQQLSNFSLANGITRLVARSYLNRGRSTRSFP